MKSNTYYTYPRVLHHKHNYYIIIDNNDSYAIAQWLLYAVIIEIIDYALWVLRNGLWAILERRALRNSDLARYKPTSGR